MLPMSQNSGEANLTIDDELWEELMALSGGEAALCFNCGVCTAACPWGIFGHPSFSIRNLVRQAQLGIIQENRDLWLCSSCAQCEVYCPRGVHVSAVIGGLRTIAWQKRTVEKGLPTALWSVYWNKNPWSQPPTQRSAWAKKLKIPSFDPQEHEILLYVGCTCSYDRRSQSIGRALVQILRTSGVRFGFLGDDEPCCGEPVLGLGHKPFFDEITQETARLFQDKKVVQVVTISPHCYDVFKNHIARLNGELHAIHYTQYLARLVEEGRLRFDRPLHERVTFQDPCYLGRRNNEYEAPRSILEAIPGLRLVEMASNRIDSLCCGGGGGRMWLETAAGERFSDLRLQQALQSGATTLATACPFCVSCLEDSAKSLRVSNLEICDVAEIAVRACADRPA